MVGRVRDFLFHLHLFTQGCDAASGQHLGSDHLGANCNLVVVLQMVADEKQMLFRKKWG